MTPPWAQWLEMIGLTAMIQPTFNVFGGFGMDIPLV